MTDYGVQQCQSGCRCHIVRASSAHHRGRHGPWRRASVWPARHQLAVRPGSFPTAQPTRYPPRHDHTTTIPGRAANDTGQQRANGVRSLDVCCWQCHHRAILSADPWPDHVPVPAFGPRMVCTRCGIVCQPGDTAVHDSATIACHRRVVAICGVPNAASRASQLPPNCRDQEDRHRHRDRGGDGCGEGNEARMTDAA